MSIESVVPIHHLILCHPLLLLPSIFPNESPIHIRWPNYWNFSFSIRPSNEYSGLISFRIEWFDLLAVHQWWISITAHLLKSTEYRTLRMYPKVCYGLWGIMIYQHRLIDCKECTTGVQNVNSMGGCTCVGETWELSTFCSVFL